MTSGLLWLGQMNSIRHDKRLQLGQSKGSHHGYSKDKIRPLDKKTIKYLFYQNDQQNSALYHAAFNGHYELVEYYLCLYLIFSIKISSETIHKNQSFRSWFQEFNSSTKKKTKKTKKTERKEFNAAAVIGNRGSKNNERSKSSPIFSLSDYDQCIVQANDDRVLNVMVKKNIDIAYAMKVIDRASFSCVPYAALIQPRMKKIYMDVKRIIEKERKKRIRKHKMVNDTDNSAIYNCHDDDLSHDDDSKTHAIRLFDEETNCSDDDNSSCFSCDEEDFIIVSHGIPGYSDDAYQISFTDAEPDLLCIEVALVERGNTIDF